MLNIIQWRTSPPLFCGAPSGSRTLKTKLTVFGGTFVHCSLGEIGFGTDWVNFAGMMDPSSNAGVVSVNPGMGGGAACGVCARSATQTPGIVKIARVVSVRSILILISLKLDFPLLRFARKLHR